MFHILVTVDTRLMSRDVKIRTNLWLQEAFTGIKRRSTFSYRFTTTIHRHTRKKSFMVVKKLYRGSFNFSFRKSSSATDLVIHYCYSYCFYGFVSQMLATCKNDNKSALLAPRFSFCLQSKNFMRPVEWNLLQAKKRIERSPALLRKRNNFEIAFGLLSNEGKFHENAENKFSRWLLSNKSERIKFNFSRFPFNS